MIISLISLCYEQFRTNAIVALALQVTRAGVAAVIIDVTLNLASNIIAMKNYFYVTLMIVCFLAAVVFDFSAILMILSCLMIGIMTAFISSRKECA